MKSKQQQVSSDLHPDRVQQLLDTAKQEPANHDDLLTVPEVARTLRVDATTVRRWIQQGALQSIVLPGMAGTHKRYRIRRTELDRVLNR